MGLWPPQRVPCTYGPGTHARVGRGPASCSAVTPMWIRGNSNISLQDLEAEHQFSVQRDRYTKESGMQSSNRKLYRRLGFQLVPWARVPENLRSCPLLFLEFLCRHRKPGIGHDSPLLSVRFLVGVGCLQPCFSHLPAGSWPPPRPGSSPSRGPFTHWTQVSIRRESL